MAAFTTKSPLTLPDPHKHVHYVKGMVLGVDDFEQEFAYLSGRDQWLARDLLGYGTVCGLQIGVNGVQVEVSPGTALTPQGQLVRVPTTQCAQLDQWLKSVEGQKALQGFPASPLGPLELYVVLCYQDCETDKVPIPGEPCRSEDESMATSRISDDFRLELRTQAPDQQEEEAIRDFVAWLSQVQIGPGPSTDLKLFLQVLRQAAHLGSPPGSPLDYMYGSPPDYASGSPPLPLQVSEADAAEYLRIAFRLWVTELRGQWRDTGADCAGTSPDEGCVLLARLEVPVQPSATGWFINGIPTVDETHRPYLLSLRMVQEDLLRSRNYQQLGGEVTGPLYDTRVARIQDIPVAPPASPPAAGEVLTLQGGQWQAAPLPDLGGDVSGAIGSNTVGRIRGVGVEPTAPAPGQLLTAFDAGGGQTRWRPEALKLQGQPVLPPPPGELGTAQNNHVLTFRAGQGWQAAPPPAPQPTGHFVGHNLGDRGLGIVAAGIIQLVGPRFKPVYPDDLRLIDPRTIFNLELPGAVIVNFQGYRNPSGEEFKYIIKAMPMPRLETEIIKNGKLINPDEAAGILAQGFPQEVNFLGFTDEGIWLQVFAAGKPLSAQLLRRLALVVEVSQFPFKPEG